MRNRPPSLANMGAASPQPISMEAKSPPTQSSTAPTDVPSKPAQEAGTAAATPTSTTATQTTAVEPTLVIAVADQHLATLIGERIHAWFLIPSPTTSHPGSDSDARVQIANVSVNVIAYESEPENAKVAAFLMSLGYKAADVESAFLHTVTLGWPDDHPDEP